MEPTFRRLLASVGARDDVALIGRVFRQLSLVELSVRPYVAPLFEALRRTSCTLGIVSNTEAVLTRFDLEHCPVLLSVDTLVLSSEVGVKKPDPRIFEVALEQLRAAGTSTVFVGNSVADDVVGARRAGLRVVYLDPDAPGVERLAGWDGSVLCARPTREELTRSLQVLGWRPPAP
jgi:putative hydrolase of the HAD superfamily